MGTDPNVLLHSRVECTRYGWRHTPDQLRQVRLGHVSEWLTPGRSLWYHYGPQSETRQLTNNAGAVVDAYVYSAYGLPLASTGSDPNPFRYGGARGYYTDATSGLILAGMRWYDPGSIRWLSRDPAGSAAGENLYRYVDDNPVAYIDPSGLCSTVHMPYAPINNWFFNGTARYFLQSAQLFEQINGYGNQCNAAMNYWMPQTAGSEATQIGWNAFGMALGGGGGGAAEDVDAGGEGITLFRGVASDHPGYADALDGNAYPIGGSATATEHNLGNTNSEFTSCSKSPFRRPVASWLAVLTFSARTKC